jgi:uncharacterized protein (DUF302 family)
MMKFEALRLLIPCNLFVVDSEKRSRRVSESQSRWFIAEPVAPPRAW